MSTFLIKFFTSQLSSLGGPRSKPNLLFKITEMSGIEPVTSGLLVIHADHSAK